MSFLHGLAFGLGMVVFIGPVFFTLLRRSLDKGFVEGAMVATGIIVSDIVALGLCMLGARPFFENEGNHQFIAIAAGILLCGIGLKYVIAPDLEPQAQKPSTAKAKAGAFAAGFMVNFINPFVFGIWIALILKGETSYGSGMDLWAFLIGVLLGIFAIDLLKAYFAQKLSRLLSPSFLKKAYLVIGATMIAFGIRAFYAAQPI